MLFSVIYSADVPADIDVIDYSPPQVDELWDKTEDDEQYEYSYLEGRWEAGHHRKWCAVLDRQQFEEFLERCGLHAEDVQTMGSLGAPGFGVGWAPAISFHSDDQDAIQSAYVTPIPEVRKQTFSERDWDRVREAVLAVYGLSRHRPSRWKESDMDKTFSVIEYRSFFAVRHNLSGDESALSDGVDALFDEEGHALIPGTPGFIGAWEDCLNANEEETLQAYFPQHADHS